MRIVHFRYGAPFTGGLQYHLTLPLDDNRVVTNNPHLEII